MASSKWKNWDEIKEIAKTRKIVFWGASIWVEKTQSEHNLAAKFIVDNSDLNEDEKLCDLIIYKPSRLLKEDKNETYLIITTAQYRGVIRELEEMGYIMGDDFCCAPYLEKRKYRDRMKSRDADLLLTSPEHRFNKTSGGGLYSLQFSSAKYEKLYTGKCRGMCEGGDSLFVVDMMRGVIIFDSKFKEIGLIELQKKAEPHGLSIDSNSGLMYVGQPGRDSVGIYSIHDGRLLEEICLSGKWGENKKDNHHINDLCVSGNSIFASVFSFSGNWGSEVYDGGILEIDLRTKKVIGPVVSNLWMPHSVKMIAGQLCYLDSMKGELYDTTWTALARFNGFVRGLDHDGECFFVGVSEHRYPEKVIGTLMNIGLDAGVYMVDPFTKMTRFVPAFCTESIHAVLSMPRAN